MIKTFNLTLSIVDFVINYTVFNGTGTGTYFGNRTVPPVPLWIISSDIPTGCQALVPVPDIVIDVKNTFSASPQVECFLSIDMKKTFFKTHHRWIFFSLHICLSL